MSYVLTNRALDIHMSDDELCFTLGYLATDGRIKYIEAQVPYGKETIFENAYPGQRYDKMLPTSDKQSFQFRIFLNYTGNCPTALKNALTRGGGHSSSNCVSKGKFVEKIINEYGFEFFRKPDTSEIRRLVSMKHPGLINEFDRGCSIPLSGGCY